MGSSVLMRCGHAANAVDHATGKPVCAICIGLTPDAEIVAEKQPDLKGRKARCVYCKREVDSSTSLAFFEYRPNESSDRYYCGCLGWD